MPVEREATIKRAETLLRRGKLADAIAEYVRLVADYPRDWNTINTLGDLYVRAGEADRAVGQFTAVADHRAAVERYGYSPLHRRSFRPQGNLFDTMEPDPSSPADPECL